MKARICALALLASSSLGCSDESTETLPPDIPDPTECQAGTGQCTGLTVCCLGSDERHECREPAQCSPTQRTLYVSTAGDDASDGLSLQTPLRTINRATELVGPGDLVLVRGGIYFEHVQLTTPGTEAAPIIFRAMPGESPVVTFGEWPNGWQAVADTRFGYEADYAYPPAYVWEHRTVSRYLPAPDLGVLDEIPGSYWYDLGRQKLVVHALHGSHPDAAMIVVVPFGGPTEPSATETYEWDKGFWPYQEQDAPFFNHIEGFTIAYQPIGIQLRMSDCQARRNRIFGCTAGITVYRGSGQVIEDNELFLNYGPGVHLGAAEETGIVVRRNLLWDNGPNAPFRELSDGGGGHPYSLAAYGGPRSFSVEDNTIIAFDPGRPIFPSSLVRYKAIQDGTVVTRGNLLVGGGTELSWGGVATIASNTLVGGELRSYETGEVMTPEWLAEHSELQGVLEHNVTLAEVPGEAEGFADPLSNDYRLREDSPLLAAGEGAFPELAPLRYVSPEGDDQANGRTPAQAWRSIAQALSASVAGETIYLLPGSYDESLELPASGTAEQPIVVKSYAGGDVILRGSSDGSAGIRADGVSHVRVRGIVLQGFSTGVALSGTEDVEIAYVVVDDATQGARVDGGGDIRLLNDTFVRCGAGLDVRALAGQLIARNDLFSELEGAPLALDEPSAALFVSETNGFADEAQLAAWTAVATEALPSLLDATAVGLSEAEGYRLPVGSVSSFQGQAHEPIGARSALPDTSPVTVERFELVGAVTDRAVLSWSTPYDFVDGVVDGLPGGPIDVAQEQFLKSTTRTFRVDGLTPGTSYHASLTVRTPDGRVGTAALDFATPASNPAPTTLYVSASGDDANAGTDSAEPLRTIGKALAIAPPGSTVRIGAGSYPESLQVWWGGLSETEPLVLQSEVPGEAVLDTGGYRDASIVLNDVSYVVIDGLRFRGLRYSDDAYAVIGNEARSITLRNSIFEPLAWPADATTNMHVVFDYSEAITITNNLFVSGFAGVRVWHGNDVTVDHNTFYRAGVYAVYLHGMDHPAYPNNVWRVANNIVVDAVGNHENAAIGFNRTSPELVCDYNLYVRTDYCPTMYLVGLDHDGSDAEVKAFNLDEVQSMFALEEHGAFADDDAAVFVDPASGELSLAAGSPAVGMDDFGGDVGYQ